MTDLTDESLRATTDVMQELTAKAGEALRRPDGRRGFFTRAGQMAGLTALGATAMGLYPRVAMASATRRATGPSSTDTVQGVIDLAATAESLAVTFYYNALLNPSGLPDVNSAANLNYFQAAVVQEYIHLQALMKLGAKPVTQKFYFPENMFTDETVFFPTAMLLEEYFIGAYLAASLDFSGAYSSGITTANPYALGFAVQVLGVEAEHRALLRVAANLNPANNVAFEAAPLKSVSAAAGPLLPFLDGGSGFVGPIAMPTQHDVNAIAQPYGFSYFKGETIV